MKLLILYIPGLGDRYDALRRLGLLTWRRPGVSIELVPMHWSDAEETFEQKLVRIRKTIDRYPDRDVVLVGESAGGAVSLVALDRFSDVISRVVTVCGMNRGADSVNPRLYEENPAFRAAMTAVDAIIPALTENDTSRIMTVYSSNDFTVRPKNTLLSGVRSYDLRVMGHMFAILTVLFIRHNLVRRRR